VSPAWSGGGALAGGEVDRPAASAFPSNGVGLRRSLGVAVYAAALVALIAGRGFTLARLMGGRYPLSYLAFDVVAFGTVIAALRLFDRLLRAGTDRLLGQETPGRRLVARAAHATILVVVAFPFILVTLQLHPLPITTTGTPQAAGLAFAEVPFSSDGRSLAGWHIPADSRDAPVVLLAHGFNANKENFLLPAVLVHQLGHDVVMFDFRAHGDSDGHSSDRMAALADRPLLLIHGTGDRLVAPREALRLYEATNGRAELWLVPGAGHVQAVDHPEYRERLRRFFAREASRPI
jgi:hypothetical protein